MNWPLLMLYTAVEIQIGRGDGMGNRAMDRAFDDAISYTQRGN